MKRILLLRPIVVLSVSCSTLDQSVRLGALSGALTGAAATYAGNSASVGLIANAKQRRPSSNS